MWSVDTGNEFDHLTRHSNYKWTGITGSYWESSQVRLTNQSCLNSYFCRYHGYVLSPVNSFDIMLSTSLPAFHSWNSYLFTQCLWHQEPVGVYFSWLTSFILSEKCLFIAAESHVEDLVLVNNGGRDFKGLLESKAWLHLWCRITFALNSRMQSGPSTFVSETCMVPSVICLLYALSCGPMQIHAGWMEYHTGNSKQHRVLQSPWQQQQLHRYGELVSHLLLFV